MDCESGLGCKVNKITSEEYLAALDDDAQEGDVYTDAGPAEEQVETSEAERAAAAASPPKRKLQEIHQYRPQRPLTASQTLFARGVIEGKSLRQAYRDAYPQAAANDASISASAARLARDPRIVEMVKAAWAETQEALTEDVAATKRYVMRQLVELSKEANQEGSRLKALELLGRAAGMWREVQTQADKPVTAADLKAALAGHLRLVSTPRKRVDVESVQTGSVETRVA